MYYVISGEAHLGNQVLRAGDSFFIPADAPYGYTPGPDGVEILEIRKDCDRFDIKIADASPDRWQAMAETTAANRERWTAEPASPTFAANQGLVLSSPDTRDQNWLRRFPVLGPGRGMLRSRAGSPTRHR